MRKNIFVRILSVIVAFLLLTGPALAALGFDQVFVIDVSGSMIGQPRGAGNKDVLEPLISKVSAYIDGLAADGSNTVHIITFADGFFDVDGKEKEYHEVFKRTISRDTEAEDKAYLRSYLEGLNAAVRKNHGKTTAVWETVAAAYDYSNKVKKEWEDDHNGREYVKNNKHIITFVTDGNDNASVNISKDDCVRLFNLHKNEWGWAWEINFVYLENQKAGKEIVDFVEKTGGQIEKDLSLKSFRIKHQLLLQPEIIDFGNLNRHEDSLSAAYRVSISSDVPLPVGAEIVASVPEFTGLPNGVEMIGEISAEDKFIAKPEARYSFDYLLAFRSESHLKVMDTLVAINGDNHYEGKISFSVLDPQGKFIFEVTPAETALKFDYSSLKEMQIVTAEDFSEPVTGAGVAHKGMLVSVDPASIKAGARVVARIVYSPDCPSVSPETQPVTLSTDPNAKGSLEYVISEPGSLYLNYTFSGLQGLAKKTVYSGFVELIPAAATSLQLRPPRQPETGTYRIPFSFKTGSKNIEIIAEDKACFSKITGDSGIVSRGFTVKIDDSSKANGARALVAVVAADKNQASAADAPVYLSRQPNGPALDRLVIDRQVEKFFLNYNFAHNKLVRGREYKAGIKIIPEDGTEISVTPKLGADAQGNFHQVLTMELNRFSVRVIVIASLLLALALLFLLWLMVCLLGVPVPGLAALLTANKLPDNAHLLGECEADSETYFIDRGFARKLCKCSKNIRVGGASRDQIKLRVPCNSTLFEISVKARNCLYVLPAAAKAKSDAGIEVKLNDYQLTGPAQLTEGDTLSIRVEEDNFLYKFQV